VRCAEDFTRVRKTRDADLLRFSEPPSCSVTQPQIVPRNERLLVSLTPGFALCLDDPKQERLGLVVLTKRVVYRGQVDLGANRIRM
jgi:hypothetical protein